jgi:hypothetical protein
MEANMAVLNATSDLQGAEQQAAHRVFPVTAKFTKDERKLVTEFARSQGIARGQWMRNIVLREIRDASLREAHRTNDPMFTELIATRMILLNLLKPLAMGQLVTPEDFSRISATVRSDKRKVAQEIQKQYTTATPKEL